ncbi:helix-turn-helix transcriptional regulator [Schaalia vaccimaxillae]|uniref:helix-turn-helix transcriptional regulator n=1 Tax=Schaalia vaccimaxillae TaxID=183916 RepID=UPI0003B348D0|nr:PAS domain-containing protein [Schaalia vaccimaxillae]
MSTIKQPEKQLILSVLQQLVDPLVASIVGPAEVALHDLERLPHSIIAISGDITGRSVGDPATDKLLESAVSGKLETNIGYRTIAPDGRDLLSTTVIVHDSQGTPVAALCINRDTTPWNEIGRLIQSATGTEDIDVASPLAPSTKMIDESFVKDIDELAQILINQAINACPVPVDQMRKEHKIDIVRVLKDRGFFLLRDAAATAGQALQCTRYTIYNYLNEIELGR